MAEAARKLPVLGDEKHGEVMHLASILLLGYVLPYSTGCDFYLLQNLNGLETTTSSSSDVVQDAVINLPLERRLEKSVRKYSTGDFGETDSLTDPYLEVSFDSFLREGLAPLLSARPFHRLQVDLLHVCAMAIHPHPTIDMIPASSRYLDSVDHPSWQKALLLMESFHLTSQFQIHYGHRVRIIQLLVKSLVLPTALDDSPDAVGPLLYGALPHLQAALRGFAQGAMSQWDARLAFACMATLSVQTQNSRVLQDDWDFLLHNMMDDQANYGCRRTLLRVPEWTLLADPPNDEQVFCPHHARGELMAALVVRSCSSRPIVQVPLLHKLTVSLADAIEWQVHVWTKPSNDKEEKAYHPPCKLASLLFAAKQLFLFQPSRLQEGDEDDACELLVKSAIGLLSHPDTSISREAAGLLVSAFSYDKGVQVDDHAALLFRSIYFCLKEDKGSLSLTELIGVACGQAPQYGLALANEILKLIEDGKKNEIVFRSLAVVALNCPAVACKKMDILMSLLDAHGTFLVQSVLSCRQGRFFVGKDRKADKSISSFLSLKSTGNWMKYRVARDALVSGNFRIAEEAFGMLLCTPLSEKNYLWILALRKLAAAELALSEKASLGIPTAVSMTRSALSYIQSQPSFTGEKDEFEFQRRFLNLRLDFLDLVTVLRQLTREVRLTAKEPSKFTRSHTHLCNVVRAFKALSLRHRELYHQDAISFSFQSRAALKVCGGLAKFVAKSAQAVYGDILPAANDDLSLSFLSEFRHPMAALIRHLDDHVVQPMESSLDPLIRSAAMLELIDAVLMAPPPFPRDFLLPKASHAAELELSASPSLLDCLRLDHIVVWPSLGFAFLARGRIPKVILKRSLVPIWNVLLWFRVTHVAPLKEDDGEGPDLSQASIDTRIPDVAAISPCSAIVSSEGNFSFEVECPPFLDEGLYQIEAKLGCRDASGTQWEIPSNKASINVRVTRS